MSNDVVISKSIQDKILNGGMTEELWKEFRASPETVSLEGVERYSTKDIVCMDADCNDDGPFVKVSDLRHLVAPVQPSAVVSLSDIAFTLADTLEDGPELLEAAKQVFALQLPQPVAPVQSGGVEGWYNRRGDFFPLSNIPEGWEPTEGWIKGFALLTTTKNAPGVPNHLELLKRLKDFVVETILPNAKNVSLDVVEELAWSSLVKEVDEQCKGVKA